MLLSDLFESKSAPLYHWLANDKLKSMIERDEMLGKWEHYMPIEGKTFNGNSFSRNPRLVIDYYSVRLTLDQAKLSSSFKIIPTDGSYVFHGKGVHQMTNVVDKKVRLKHLDNLRDRSFLSDKKNFSEEFVVGDIKNLHKYITEIAIDTKFHAYKKYLIEYCKKFNIKFNLFKL